MHPIWEAEVKEKLLCFYAHTVNVWSQVQWKLADIPQGWKGELAGMGPSSCQSPCQPGLWLHGSRRWPVLQVTPSIDSRGSKRQHGIRFVLINSSSSLLHVQLSFLTLARLPNSNLRDSTRCGGAGWRRLLHRCPRWYNVECLWQILVLSFSAVCLSNSTWL